MVVRKYQIIEYILFITLIGNGVFGAQYFRISLVGIPINEIFLVIGLVIINQSILNLINKYIIE
jgi:hypothetical protein